MMDGSTLPAQATPAGRIVITLLLLSGSVSTLLFAAPVESRSVTVEGTFEHAGDVSAVEVVGPFVYLASDEGRSIHLLEPFRDGYRVAGDPIVLLAGSVEADLEGLAAEGPTLYAVGSHSLKRRKLDPDKTGSSNRARLQRVVREASRYYLYRLRLDPETGRPARPIERISLGELLRNDVFLSRFTDIPGKENGIDVEGLAVDAGRLFVGLRSPVLRGGVVPVIVLRFDSPSAYTLRFVDSGGRGIRSMAAVKAGFLVILAHERAGPGDYELCLWNGSDRFSDGAAGVHLRCLGSIPARSGGKPEGLALLGEDEQRYRLLVTYDGVPGGGAAHLVVDK